MLKKNEVTLKEAIDQLVKQYHMEDKFVEAKLRKDWKEVAGPMIAVHTLKLFIKKRTLHIHLDSAPLRQEVHMMKDRFIEVVNDHIGHKAVDKIILG